MTTTPFLSVVHSTTHVQADRYRYPARVNTATQLATQPAHDGPKEHSSVRLPPHDDSLLFQLYSIVLLLVRLESRYLVPCQGRGQGQR